jgi:hypothetical protein
MALHLLPSHMAIHLVCISHTSVATISIPPHQTEVTLATTTQQLYVMDSILPTATWSLLPADLISKDTINLASITRASNTRTLVTALATPILNHLDISATAVTSAAQAAVVRMLLEPLSTPCAADSSPTLLLAIITTLTFIVLDKALMSAQP